MKRIKILCALAMLLAVTGCKNKQDPFKTDEMLPYKNEITFAEFYEQIEKITGGDSEGSGEGEEQEKVEPDVVKEGTIKETQTTKIIRNEAEAFYSDKDLEMKAIAHYDGSTDVAKYNYKGHDYRNLKEVGSEETVPTRTDFDVTRFYQEETIEDIKSTVAINVEKQEYYNLGTYDNHEPEDIGTDAMALPLLFIMFSLGGYEESTDDVKARFKFYKDDDVFTTTYKEVDVLETKEKYSELNNNDVVFQLAFKTEKENLAGLSIKYEGSGKTVTTYTDDYGGTYKNGDVREKEDYQKGVFTMLVKDVSLARTDLSGYTLKTSDPDYQYSIFG